MGIADLKSAFNSALDGKATCLNCTMRYLPNERMQRVVFTIQLGNSIDTLTEDVPPGVDLTTKARQIAEAFAAQIGV